MEQRNYKTRKPGESCDTCSRSRPHPKPDRTNGRPLMCACQFNKAVPRDHWCVGFEKETKAA